MEIAYEVLYGALEAVKGTAETTPTHLLNAEFTMTPRRTWYRPREQRGKLAEFYRSRILRRWAEWKAVGPCDPRLLPFWLEMVLNGAVAPVQQAATAAYLSAYPANMTADDLKSATFWTGDPNVSGLRAGFAMCDELVIRSDVANENALEYEASGWANEFTVLASPSAPTLAQGMLLDPMTLQLWMDTTSAIGTTEITGRVLSAALTLRSGVAYKWVAHGDPTKIGNFTGTGRKARHAELRIVLEVPDTTQIAAFIAGATWKTRIKWTGDTIASTYKYYVQADIYGALDAAEWGSYQDANRTLVLTILSEYDATATHDVSVSVMHNGVTV